MRIHSKEITGMSNRAKNFEFLTIFGSQVAACEILTTFGLHASSFNGESSLEIRQVFRTVVWNVSTRITSVSDAIACRQNLYNTKRQKKKKLLT